MDKLRIFLSGVGGQGTLTATNLIGLMAMNKGIEVVCGEIHGMAQRGGSVESYVILGGFRSPKIDVGEADILMAFEPLEGIRFLHFLKPDGVLLMSTDPIYPPEVNLGKVDYPEFEHIKNVISNCTDKIFAVPSITLAKTTGVVQTANIIMLACFCMLDVSSFSLEDLKMAINMFLPPKVQSVNLKAVDVAREFVEKNGWR